MSNYSSDSRKIEDGDTFVAISGENTDGHFYLEEASRRGAKEAIVLKSYQGLDFGMKLHFVDDCIQAIQEKARQNILLDPPKCIVGITGSVGKTSIKEYLATLLNGSYRVFKTPGNQNSQVGLPLSILNRKGKEEVFVLEMGMSQRGELANLVKIAPPDIVIMGRIGHSHTEFFASIEDVAKTKSEIYLSENLSFAAISYQSYPFSSLVPDVPHIFCGEGADYIDEKRVVINQDKSPDLSIPLKARHERENLLLTMIVARRLQVSWNEIAQRLQLIKQVPHRFEFQKRDGILFIDDSYNASPESMIAALKNVPQGDRNIKKIGVFGEMKELGEISEKAHFEVGEFAAKYLDRVFCLGEGCLPLQKAFMKSGKKSEVFLKRNDLEEALLSVISPGDCVLLKGANSHKLWLILQRFREKNVL